MAYGPNKNGTPDKIIVREEEVFRLRRHGWSQCRIAEELDIAQSTVARAMKRATKRFAQCFLKDIKQVKDEHVVQLEHVADEAMGAWEKSKQNRMKKTTRRKGTGGDGDVSIEGQNQFGDPRFLAEFRKAKEDIRKVLGIEHIQEVEGGPAIGKIRVEIMGINDDYQDC